MPSFRKSSFIDFLFPSVSGILSGISLLYFIHWLAWVMLVPLFYSILKEQKRAFLKGAIAGFIQGLILLSWMISSVGNYTGVSSNIGFTLWLISACSYALFTGIIVWLISFVSRKYQYKKMGWLILALFAGSMWILFEWARFKLSPGIPWLNFQVGCSQTIWNVPLQISSVTGIAGISFLIVFVNMVLADYIVSRKYSRLFISVSVYLLLILVGLVRLEIGKKDKIHSVQVAILCENMNAHDRWLPENGDSLANVFFRLNLQAVDINPQLIVWSESALPWNLAMDDDLITQCLNITWPVRAGHILGIFSPAKNNNTRYNSAYYIEPDGAITGRYDKMRLLTFLEKPFAGAKLPFFKKSIHKDIIPGEKLNLLKTAVGKAGILICNESLISESYREYLKKGADFFVVISNDAWFEGCELIQHHFYINRLRAVEFGKDIVINANRGISGIINRKGEIQIMDNKLKPTMIHGAITTKNQKTVYAKHGDWFVILSAIYSVTVIFTLILTKNQKK